MPTISLTLSAAAANELTDALTTQYGYQPTINGAPNPETANQFTRRMIAMILKERVREHRQRQAAAAVSAIDPDIT